jgi:glutaredoxin-like protein
MSLQSPAEQQTLRDMLSAMQRQVTLLFFTQSIGCETCVEARQLLAELTSASDRIVVEELNPVLDKDQAAQYGIDRAPAIVLLEGDARTDTRIRFLGAPAGFDFAALVDAVLLVSGGRSVELSAGTQARLAALQEPLGIRVFVTPTCGFCPRAVALANRLAFVSPLVTTTTVQATEFYDLAREYRVSGVPKTVATNGHEVLGALPESQFVEALLAGDDSRQS